MLKTVDYSFFKGLTEREVSERINKNGYNELPSLKRKSIFMIAFEVIKEPMFILLLAGCLIYFLLGEVQDTLMLLVFVFFIMGITFYQEKKTERALEALRDLSSPRALVIREGEAKRIAGREVVIDDIIILSEGDRVPADAIILQSQNLSVDESMLTGESVPVIKYPFDKSEPAEAGENNRVYSGTMVVQGQGIAKVYATGFQTELGKIGKSLNVINNHETSLQRETARLVKLIAIMGFIICTFLVIVYGITRYVPAEPLKSWIDGVLAGITLAMAIVPEEFPVVLTIFLALGAWRISKKNVLTRKSSAIESLGAATVLCVDKTGTLTINQMKVGCLYSKGKIYYLDDNKKLPEEFHHIVEYSILASQKSPFDPMEKAIHKLGEIELKNTEHIHEDWEMLQEYSLSRELMAMSIVWKNPQGNKILIASKGAPEAILDLCHTAEEEKNYILKGVEQLASEGFRILGVARAYFNSENLPDIQHDFDFEFIGLIGLSDPIRDEVPEAVKECYRAKIRLIMITGDYPITAQNIAKQIGLKNPEGYITGAQLSEMKEEELLEKIKGVNIFARISPEKKLIIVNALKKNGEIVAMTGDGVNDAPALKSAHIGIAMGARGTDVAREAADLVLLNDNFSSIVGAIRMGRRIYDNIQKAMSYIIAVHIPIAGISLLPVLLKTPMVLMPVHIVFLEIIIDPACSIVFEAEEEEEGIMEKPPRPVNAKLFDLKRLILSSLQGISVLFIILSIYGLSYASGHNEDDIRTLTFATLIIANLGLILSNRSWNSSIWKMIRVKNNSLWFVIIGALTFLAISIYIPFMQNLFSFTYLHPFDIAICLFGGLVGILWFELLKILPIRKKLL